MVAYSVICGGILPKFELTQAFMHVLVTCNKEEDPIKMKRLECSQDFSHYKTMGIFPHAQGQLTLQSMVGSGRISNSSETLWLSSLPAKTKNIRSKMKALECSQHYNQIFRRTRADNSWVGGGIWPKFELIQAFMHVLVTCKNEDN